MKVLKKIIRVTVALLAGVALALLIFMGAHTTLTHLPLTIEIQEPTNITTTLPLHEQRTL